MIDSKYTIRCLDFSHEDDLERLVELQNKVYEQRRLQFSKDSFRHWYVENPIGRVLSFNAFDGEKMVAHYACIPTIFEIDGRVTRGILSMATVTHPDYRGQGLFKELASLTYEYARKNGYEFVIGVANANSFPGFMKHFPFVFVKRLDVKLGWGNVCSSLDSCRICGVWSKERIDWRTKCCGGNYKKGKDFIRGKYKGLVNTFMGMLPKDELIGADVNKDIFSLIPNLYVGTGMKLKGIYFKIPKFIKHSPFNLIFMDLTDDKHLPIPNKDNIVFQLIDFDVA